MDLCCHAMRIFDFRHIAAHPMSATQTERVYRSVKRCHKKRSGRELKRIVPAADALQFEDNLDLISSRSGHNCNLCLARSN
jgi:hypothetical protein